jgi:mannose-6-phosphate isomerase-like protein (cupin superfamily)
LSTRRVVTGNDANGQSVVVSDEVLDVLVFGNFELTQIWKTDRMPPDLVGGDLTPGPFVHDPPPGGLYWRVLVRMPDNQSPEPDGAGEGRIKISDFKSGDMHTTETIDLFLVISGEIWLELDSSEVHLRPGDSVVLRGSAHAWHNYGTEPSTLVAVAVSTQPI